MTYKQLGRIAALLTAMAIAALAGPGSAGAAGSCAPADSQAVCQALDDCYITGANYPNDPAAAAVTFYKDCLGLDQGFVLTGGTDGIHLEARKQIIRRYSSTFWMLYCGALSRTGDTTTCAVTTAERASFRRPPTRKRHTTRRSTPRFTG
jgi:hypothetical protein